MDRVTHQEVHDSIYNTLKNMLWEADQGRLIFYEVKAKGIDDYPMADSNMKITIRLTKQFSKVVS